MGEEPSQQPPDWWNRIGPCLAVSSAIKASAAGVAPTRLGAALAVSLIASEEAQLLRAIADQHVLGLLVVVEHHAVVLPPDAGLLVAAEGRVGRIGVVAVGPHPTGLDGAPEAIAAVDVAAPDPGAETIEGVVGDRQRLFVVLEGGHRHDRPEDLLLEDAHLVVALEHGRLD